MLKAKVDILQHSHRDMSIHMEALQEHFSPGNEIGDSREFHWPSTKQLAVVSNIAEHIPHEGLPCSNIVKLTRLFIAAKELTPRIPANAYPTSSAS